MIKLNKFLTILILVLAGTTILVLSYNQLLAVRNNYTSIQYSYTRYPPVYDFSCGESDYQIHFVITNTGQKNIVNLSATLTNPLCVGSTPILPQMLNASSTVSFYTQTTNPNGTLTILGNNTLVRIKF